MEDEVFRAFALAIMRLMVAKLGLKRPFLVEVFYNENFKLQFEDLSVCNKRVEQTYLGKT